GEHPELVSSQDAEIARSRAEQAAARASSAQARIEAADAALRYAQATLENTYIRAPFTGTVLRKEAEVGEVVAPSVGGGLTRGAVVTMADLGSLEVEVDVNEGYVARARQGMRAEITLDAYPSERYPGHARQIVPTADRQKATVQIKVSFDSLDARVLPEMGAKVTFLADPAPSTSAGGAAAPAVVWIPRAAVRDREGRAVIYVVEGDRARERAISPRPLGPDRVSVSGGLAAGEAVVVEAPPELKDKSRIRVK
ncbi:MAG TPA: efflux RND transporter periplasmic adaptor subunit, partial [Candidatus Dormibacteraeota bacterium]|nr:efflux RND transporter periplasmic adaptor subunit [Candidatus Dormibacteraeota bacterium]